MKKTFLLLTLTLLTITICAQDVEKQKTVNRFGVKSGINISGVRFIDSDFQQLVGNDLERIYNGSFGIFGETGSDYFVTQLGLQYYGKGFASGDNYTTRFHTIQFPLMLNFRLPIIHTLAIQMGMGAYGSFAFMARENSDGVINEDLLSFKTKIESHNDADEVKSYNPIDFGLSFGGCVEYEYMDGKIVELGFHYDLGLWKVSNEYEFIEGGDAFNPGMKNDAFVISLTFLFDKNKPALKPKEKSNP